VGFGHIGMDLRAGPNHEGEEMSNDIRRLQAQMKTLIATAGEETTLGQAILLLEVAIHPGERLTHIGLRLPWAPTHTMVSRSIDTLSDHQGRNLDRKPVGLVERRDDPNDRRVREIFLTPKGKRLMKWLEQ
jgi:DNA-binding MarR family transcriptional regulator